MRLAGDYCVHHCIIEVFDDYGIPLLSRLFPILVLPSFTRPHCFIFCIPDREQNTHTRMKLERLVFRRRYGPAPRTEASGQPLVGDFSALAGPRRKRREKPLQQPHHQAHRQTHGFAGGAR